MVVSLLEMIIERGSQKLYKSIASCPLCDKCYRQVWGKYGFSCGYIFCG